MSDLRDNGLGFSRSEAAKITGLSVKAIKNRLDRGTLYYETDDKGVRRIPLWELERITNKSIQDLGFNPYENPLYDIPKAEVWGDGKAKLVQPATSGQWETVVYVSDIHVPWHADAVIQAAAALIADLQPDRVVINGDTQDFFMLSRFNKASERLELLQSELDIGKEVRRLFRNAAPNAIFDETIGNHEERLLTYPAFNAPALISLDALKPSTMLGLDELEINHHPRCGFLLREDFLVEHGQVIRKHAGDSAKARLNDTLISGIMGHTHRLGSATRSGYRELRWFEQGCLCQLNPDYVIGEANWKQGFAIGTHSTRSSNFDVQLIPVVGEGFIFDGKHYGDTNAEINLFSGPEFTDKIPLFEHYDKTLPIGVR